MQLHVERVLDVVVELMFGLQDALDSLPADHRALRGRWCSARDVLAFELVEFVDARVDRVAIDASTTRHPQLPLPCEREAQHPARARVV